MNSSTLPDFFTGNPKRIFRMDAAGAVLTAVLLSQVLARQEVFFGMPQQTLYYLAGVASLFACYSMVCSFIFPFKWKPLLRIIIMANLIYSALTALLVIYHWKKISIWGISYFLLEIIVITVLVLIESRTVSRN